MRSFQSYHFMLLLILIPPILAACLCVANILPYSIEFFNSSSFPNYLWSLRITRELSKLGYPVHDVSVSASKPPGFETIDIQVGNLIQGEQQRTYELVKTVHKVVIETFEVSSFQPDPVNVIVITLFDYSSGSYFIGGDFDTIRRYNLGEISEDTYFAHWFYEENTPGITPP